MEVKDADNYSSIQPKKKSQSKNNRHFPTEVEILSGCEIIQSRLGMVEEITQVQKPNCKK